MITKEQAENIAQNYLNESSESVELVVVSVSEAETYYKFGYNSRKYMETKKLEDMMFSSSYLFVRKRDGVPIIINIFMAGKELDRIIDEYQC